jgi:chemotaxis protein MotB
VSNSTYEEALGRIDSLQTSNDSLEKVIYGYRGDIAGLESQVDANNRRIAQLQQELADTKKLYETVKNSASQTTQELLSDIERLRKEKISLQTETDRINNLLRQRDEKINSLMSKLKQALLGFENSGLSLEIKDGRVYVSLSNQLLFPSGSIEINDKGKEALMNLSQVLRQMDDINALVEGHTDDKAVRGGYRFKDNWELSVLRATEVVKYMVDEGDVSPEKIIASGRSQYFPLNTADTDDARAMNRRTEIILTPDLGEIYEILKG